jgi:acetyltransferase-like isoleucine patch superfamily enzyme
MNIRKEASRGRYRPHAYLETLRTVLRPNGFLHFLARVLPGGFSLRPFLHRLRGVKIGSDVWIGDDVYLDEDYPEAVEIQEGTAIATRCTIIAHTKGVGRIVIERNAAIGAGCIIVCASGQTLTIGEGSVVSAGSTVSNSIPPYTLCGPPRIQTFGKVEIPFRTAATLEEFKRGLTPVRSKSPTLTPVQK